MDKPLVTIITATYNLIENNRKDYFLQMVNSVRNQTYPNIEHIIIDGGSNDGSIELFKELGLKYFSEKDEGIYYAFNKGINKASGKYVNFMNSDDFFNNNRAVELSVCALEKSQADFSAASAIIDWGESGKSKFKPNFYKVFFRMPFCHQTMFCKTDVIKKENLFDLNFKSASDYHLILRLFLKKYNVVKVNATIVTFRAIGESALHQKLSIKEQIAILKEVYSKYTDKFSDEDYFLFYSNMYIPHEIIKKIDTLSFLQKLFLYYRCAKFVRRKILHICSSVHKEKKAFSIFGKYYIKPSHTPLADMKNIDDFIK